MGGEPVVTEPTVVRQMLQLPQERERLLRLCYRWTNGNKDAAEDIVQETMVLAWTHAQTLRHSESWQPWLSGIARNLYLRWLRQQGREAARQGEFYDAPDENADALDKALEKQEITDLLSRALATLTPDARDLLIAHYVDDTPHAEMAARLGIRENAATVRLHRSKQQLRRILSTSLRADAMAYGLIDAQEAGWQETRLWCPYCGERHLHGYFDTETPGLFKLRCDTCYFVMGPRQINYPSDCIFAHHRFDATRVLGDVRGFKPAMNRLNHWWGQYFQEGMKNGQVHCVGCRRRLSVKMDCPSHLNPDRWRGFHVHCEYCDKIHVILPSALTLTAPPVQDFWRRYPRMRHLPATPTAGGKGLVIGIESLTNTARLDVVLSRETYRIVEVREYAAAKGI